MHGLSDPRLPLIPDFVSTLQHVDPSRVVHEAEVEHGRAAEVLRAARVHLRAAQGNQAAVR